MGRDHKDLRPQRTNQDVCSRWHHRDVYRLHHDRSKDFDSFVVRIKFRNDNQMFQ